MLDLIKDSLNTYYGMDWATMLFGMIGSYMIASQNPTGFLLSALACVFGFGAALLSSQYGFIVHNSVLMIIMLRGYYLWMQKPPKDSHLKEDEDIILDAAE